MNRTKDFYFQKRQLMAGILIIAFFATGSLLFYFLQGVAFGYGGGIGSFSVGDTTPPSISNINVAVSANEATITWITNESSISWVVYGATTAYGSEVKTTTYVTSHSVILTNLTPSTTYHYSVKSKDSVGNIGSYTDQTFTTLTEEKVVTPAEEVKIPTIEKPISQMTAVELQTKITEISAAITKLQVQLKGLVAVTGCTITSFERNLSQGYIGSDVKCLQIILNKDSATQVAASGVGSPGSETTYLGILTRAAVVKFQEKYASEVLAPLGLTKGTGFIGKATRTKLNELLAK